MEQASATASSIAPAAQKLNKTLPADDVQPSSGATPDPTTNLQAVRPKTFRTPSKARISSRTNPRAANKPTLDLPPPKYHVARSSNKNLPIYTDYKRGGNLHLTTIRKITGDLSALRDELRVFLNKKNEDVKINSLTQHVIIKGHHVPEITEFLRARGM
ncbi:54S ribosomal protein img2, mitochondrial [Kalmusia sp. IMI 367209]|nr:54S ribosomal protein img2, mitochondrial [Kalmusia sp. IMI 367209]